MEAIVYTTKGGSTMDAIKNIIIRLETKEDYRAVENLTRESFWNVYRPGCMEHYVLHCYRDDPAFVPELDFVISGTYKDPDGYFVCEKDPEGFEQFEATFPFSPM